MNNNVTINLSGIYMGSAVKSTIDLMYCPIAVLIPTLALVYGSPLASFASPLLTNEAIVSRVSADILSSKA